MSMMRNIIFFVAFIVSYAQLNAQNVRRISLQEAVELGVANSKNLKIDSAKIAEATAAIDEAKNKQLPDLNVSGSYLRLTNANVNINTSSTKESAKDAPNENVQTSKVNQAVYGMANFSLPIFAGGRIKYGIESAKYLLEAAKLNTGSDRNTIAYNISQAYVNLFKASQAVNVIKENLETSKKRDADFLNLENNGIIARNDRL